MSSNADVIGAAPVRSASRAESASLHRKIDWTGAFWVASGVPALVLFSIGAIAATVGKPSWMIWALSIGFGFIQAFTYAEIAGLFSAGYTDLMVDGAPSPHQSDTTLRWLIDRLRS